MKKIGIKIDVYDWLQGDSIYSLCRVFFVGGAVIIYVKITHTKHEYITGILL